MTNSLGGKNKPLEKKMDGWINGSLEKCSKESPGKFPKKFVDPMQSTTPEGFIEIIFEETLTSFWRIPLIIPSKFSENISRGFSKKKSEAFFRQKKSKNHDDIFHLQLQGYFFTNFIKSYRQISFICGEIIIANITNRFFLDKWGMLLRMFYF